MSLQVILRIYFLRGLLQGLRQFIKGLAEFVNAFIPKLLRYVVDPGTQAIELQSLS
jgi:hypothetical protein